MRAFPKLRLPAVSRKATAVFGGYNHNPVINDGEFYDMQNMTSDLYPVASVRKARSAFEYIGGAPMQDCIALHHRDDFPVTVDAYGNIYCGGNDEAHMLSGLLELGAVFIKQCSVSGVTVQVDEDLFMRMAEKNENILFTYSDFDECWKKNGVRADPADYGISVRNTPQGWPNDGDTISVCCYDAVPPDSRKKQIVSMGAWCIIWPDKVYFNAVKLANGDELTEGVDYGHLQNVVEIAQGGLRPRTIGLKLCDANGEEYTDPYWGNTAPSNPQDGDYWADISNYGSQGVTVLKQYSSAQQAWSVIAPTYMRMRITYLDEDGETTVEEEITKGFAEGDSIKIDLTAPANQQLQKTLDRMKERYIKVQKIDGNQLILLFDFENISDVGFVHGTLSLDCPAMDYIVECGNRLWGCYYGIEDGEHINEIYACKLGDFKNWNTFAGISTDSYVASRGADGKYTGAAVLNGNPLFFRERSFEKVYPSAGGAHQIITENYAGIQDGSWMSPVVIEGTLFYKGTDGVYAYTGSVPRLISAPLGGTAYCDAVAAPMGRKYYISMRNSKNEWSLFVFDTEKGLWHREDDTQFDFAAQHKGCLYYITPHDGFGWKIGGVDVCRNVPWMIESGIIGLSLPDQKRISRIVLRLRLELGATAKISVQYDSNGRWLDKMTLRGNGLRTMVAPIVPIRCDHMKIRMSGTGGMELYSIAYSLEQGSDVP